MELPQAECCSSGVLELHMQRVDTELSRLETLIQRLDTEIGSDASDEEDEERWGAASAAPVLTCTHGSAPDVNTGIIENEWTDLDRDPANAFSYSAAPRPCSAARRGGAPKCPAGAAPKAAAGLTSPRQRVGSVAHKDAGSDAFIRQLDRNIQARDLFSSFVCMVTSICAPCGCQRDISGTLLAGSTQ